MSSDRHREMLHRLSTGLLHRLLAAGGKTPATNVPSGRVQPGVVFYVPLDFDRMFWGKSTGLQSFVEKLFLTLPGVGGRMRQNLHIVLDRIVKPHI
jgi:hypothetical protein